MLSFARLLSLRLCASVLLLVCLAACGGEPPPPPTAVPTQVIPTPVNPIPTNTPQPTLLPGVTPTPTPMLRSQTLPFWVEADGPLLAELVALAAAFNATHHASIAVVARPLDGLRPSLATAQLLDEPLPALLWANQSTLAGLIVDGQIQAFPAERVASDTFPALLTAARRDAQLWGLPVLAHNNLVLLYNRELVEDAPPSTSDQLIVQSRAAATPLVAGLVMGWNEAYWTLPWLYAFGGAPTTPDGQTITLDTPAMTPTLNLMRELYAAAPQNGDGYARGQRLLTQGYAAFAIDGDWAWGQYLAVSATLELGVAPLPIVPATGRRALPPLGGSYVMLGRTLEGAPHADALAFVELLASPAVQAQLARASGQLPATDSALELLDLSGDPLLSIAARHVATAPGLAPTQATHCALYGLAAWLPSLFSGRLELAAAASTMQREAEVCLER
ncbi:MAG: extracellular solute-binding protein [Candidatus Viridilinea halotolerans]|uniref:Extracellular solute-binding protein n=1 Tax=Candidatus Viridilinea halotolerans TaxID=2491704 RepID=A0A426TYW1_9CHLR|nr:MAG: extracellular solute-binding protein [Candidatus Viridilinea halotolerans]